MAHGARIRTSAWLARLYALVALACGCGLDSRELAVTTGWAGVEPESDASTAQPRSEAAFDRFRLQRASYAPVVGPINGAEPAGRGGAASGSGSGSAGMAGSVPPGIDAGIDSGASQAEPCHELIVSSEWVDSFSNCLEIQGKPFATNPDSGSIHSTHLVSMPICMAEASPSAAGPATFGLFLNQASAGAEAADYDARLHRVSGFRYRISPYLDGDPLPFVGVESQGVIYCMPTPPVGDHEFDFDDLRARCWEPSPGPAPDPEHVRSLLFYYPPAWPGEPIGMCFDDVFAIVGAP